MKWMHWALFIVLIIAIFSVIIFFSLQPQESRLSVELDSFSGKAGTSVTLNFTVRNKGSEVTGATVNFESTAFQRVSSDKLNLATDETKNVSCTVQISDNVANSQYSIDVSYTCNGETKNIDSHPTCYVIPSLEVVDEFWYRPPGYPLLAQEKSTIGSNDNTTLYFHIKNNGKTTYTHLSATANPQAGTSTLTITPNFDEISDVGPSLESSQEYSFGLVSNNMPPGKYTITIKILSDNQYEAGSKDVWLWVSP